MTFTILQSTPTKLLFAALLALGQATAPFQGAAPGPFVGETSESMHKAVVDIEACKPGSRLAGPRQSPEAAAAPTATLLAGLDCNKLGGSWALASCGGPFVYGKAGAAMPGATITITTSMHPFTFTTTAAADGSFHRVVDCAKNEEVTVTDGTTTCKVKVRYKTRES